MALLDPEPRQHGHDVVAVDLPADDDAAGLSEYAAAEIRAVIDQRNVALVAQLMAGFTAPMVCQHHDVGTAERDDSQSR